MIGVLNNVYRVLPVELETFHYGSGKRYGRLTAAIELELSMVAFCNRNGGRSSYVSTVEITVDESLFHIYGHIDTSVIIEGGKEVILYKPLFTNRGSKAAYANQTLQERPELLNEY